MPQRFHHNGRSVEVKIDIDTCTACQLCYDRLPQVFTDRGDGIPLVVFKVPIENLMEELIQIAEDCPSNSILIL